MVTACAPIRMVDGAKWGLTVARFRPAPERRFGVLVKYASTAALGRRPVYITSCALIKAIVTPNGELFGFSATRC